MSDSDIWQIYEQRYASTLVGLARSLESHITRCIAGLERIDRVTARAKSVDRFVRKAQKTKDGRPKYNDPLGQIQDQVGARIVVFYLSDVDVVDRCVEENFRAIEQQNFIPESVKEFGYAGRHYILSLPTDVWDRALDPDVPPFFELQVKTLFQHAWSEAEHDLGYKPDIPLTSDQKRRMAFTAAQAWGADAIFEEIHRSNREQSRSYDA